MEATEDQRLDQILPPRLEDAGLEECALPLNSIQEAFQKAAAAVKSRAAAILSFSDDEDDSCVDDPWSEAGKFPGPCVAVKGRDVTESGGDDVVVAGGGEEKKGGKDCVDGLRELEIGDEKEKNDGGRDDDEERPVLVGGYV